MDQYRWVKNAERLATTRARADALGIIESTLNAVETEKVVERQVRLDGDVLSVSGHPFDLSRHQGICLLGFGKVACTASKAIERILGGRIRGTSIIRSASVDCGHAGHMPATHPLPSEQNFEHTQHLLKAAVDCGKDALFLVIVSGGGSAMLCDSLSECDQGRRLYRDGLRTGMTIKELNTVRKHLSGIKGGGLARLLAPAHVVGLIFSDVPGTSYDLVASGPLWPDPSSVADARAVLDRYGLTGYELNETPKEKDIFENVTNIVLVSNRAALDAMAVRATQLGYRPDIVSDSIYDTPESVIAMLARRSSGRAALLAGGEFRITVSDGGRGGRNTRASLVALDLLDEGELFVAFASDGIDNSAAAGAIADGQARDKAARLGLDIRSSLDRYDDLPFFERTGDLIMTGPTGANVSDLMFLLSE